MANGVTSEWEDIHVRLGNYIPREKETPQWELNKEEIEKAENYDPLEKKTKEELDELEDDIDDDFLEQYKRKRLAEMQNVQTKPKFGEMKQINKQEYVREVTEAPEDVFAILLLYQDYNEKSLKMGYAMAELAKRYVHHKFMMIKADKCIENFPDQKVPALLIYKNGKLGHNIMCADEMCPKLNEYGVEEMLKILDVLPRGDDDEEKQKYTKFQMKKNVVERNKDADLSDSDDDDRGYSSANLKKFWERVHRWEKELKFSLKIDEKY